MTIIDVLNYHYLFKMDLKLKNKVALITGSSRGLGFATAQELLSEGAKVVICSRNQDHLGEALSKLKSIAVDGNSIFGTITDVSNESQIQSLINQAIDHFGQLDILITNAGGPPAGPFESHNLLTWKKAIDQTLLGTVQLIYYAQPHLLNSTAPAILTISSISGKQPIPDLIIGNTLRPALIGLTKSLANELGPQNIRVNSILPGWTETERSKELLIHMAAKNHRTVQDEYADKESKIPLRRIGQPTEFAKVATFLVSPAASYINGTMVLVDGGLYGGF